MGKIKIFIAFVCLIALAVIFQNCGNQLRSTAVDQQSNSRLEGDGIAFFAGQDYDPSLLPYELTDQADIDAANGYSNLQGFKSIAFTEDGELFIANGNSQYLNTQQEWDRVVLERCQIWSMNKACSLFASGNVIAQDAEHFLDNFVRTVQVPATFDGNMIPGEIDYWRTFIAGRYPDFTNNAFKAFAIGPRGGSQSGWSDVSQAEATRRAMEYCEALINTPCTLYAEGLGVVFNLDSYQFDQQRIFYAPRAFNVDEIPFISEATRETIRTNYNQAMANGENFLLWMDRYGNTWQMLRSANNVNNRDRQDALNRCNANVPPPPVAEFGQRTCFFYSENNQVMMTRDAYLNSY